MAANLGPAQVTTTTKYAAPNPAEAAGPNWLLLGGLAAVGYLLLRPSPTPPAPAPSTPAPPAPSPASPPLGVPGAPVELQQVGGTATSVTVECAPVVGAVQYNWYQYGTNLLLATSPTNVAIIDGLQANTAYEVYCVAINAAGQAGPPSQPLLVTTGAGSPVVYYNQFNYAGTQPPPSPPQAAVTVTVLTPNPQAGQPVNYQAALSNGPPNSTPVYTLGQTGGPVAWVITVTDAAGNTVSSQSGNGYAVVNGSFTPSAAGTYTITAQATYNNQTWTGSASVAVGVGTGTGTGGGTPSPTPPAVTVPPPPTALTVTSITESQIQVAWAPVSTANIYQVLLNGSVVQTTAGTTAVLDYLRPGTTYTIGVTACNAAGCSTPALVQATTQVGLTSTQAPQPVQAPSTYPSYTDEVNWHASMAAAVGQFTNEIPHVRTPTPAQTQQYAVRLFPNIANLPYLLQQHDYQAANIGLLVNLNGLRTPPAAAIPQLAQALAADAGLVWSQLDEYSQQHIAQTANLYLMEGLNHLGFTPVQPATAIGNAVRAVFAQWGIPLPPGA